MENLKPRIRSKISVQIIRLSFVMLLGSLIFGCKTNKRSPVYPPEKFSVLQSKLSNGNPVVGSINMAYKTYDRKDEYPWCLVINMALDTTKLYKNGLPQNSESNIANKYEDQLLKKIKEITTAHYIGHLYNDTFLDIYIYFDKPEKVNDFLQKEMDSKIAARPFAFKITNDPDWQNVKPFFKTDNQ